MRTGTINTASFIAGGLQDTGITEKSDSFAFQNLMQQASGNTRQPQNAQTDLSETNPAKYSKSNQSEAFKKSTGQADNTKESTQPEQKTVSNSDSATKKAEKKNERNNVSDQKDDLLEKLEELQDKVTELITKELGVTEEQLNDAMQTLGLTTADLFDPNPLAKLVAKLTGGMDVSSLLLKEDAYQKFTSILNAIEVLEESTLDQLGFSKEELEDMLNQLDQEVSEGILIAAEGTEADSDVSSDDRITEIKDNSNVTIVNGKTDSKEMKFSNEWNEASQSETEVQSKAEETDIETFDLPVRKTLKDDAEFLSGNETMNGIRMPESILVETSSESTVDTLLNSYLNAKDIIDQISEQIQVSVREDTSKMEIQLNPENLGKVTVQVEVKDGVVTAQLTAQNHAVKEAMESQIVQLRERMDSQGLKVDAVEVTLESHGFERNLDQNHSDSNQQAKPRNSSRRQLSVSSLEEFDNLTEEEELITNIMVGNGNSIDYTA